MNQTRGIPCQRKTMAVLVVSACAALAVPAAAQTGTPATASAEAGEALQSVTITAQKRTEVLKDTPVSGNVIGAADLARMNATTVTDLNNLVPSVQVKEATNVRAPMAMRGISTNANPASMVGLTSGVSVMIDGIPVSPDGMAANFIPPDLQRMEVLKGPQSTLGGRTASAGVINYVTRKPSRQFKGDLALTATSDREYKGSISLSGPAGDMVSYSLAGYSNRLTSELTNVRDGGHPKSSNAGVRGKLLIQPNADLDITLAARSGEFDSTGASSAYQYLQAPGGPFQSAGIGGVAFGGPTLAQAFPGVTIRPGNMDYNSFVDVYNHGKFKDASLNLDYSFGDGYTFSSTTAYQEEVQDRSQDVPNIAVPLSTGFGYDNATRQHLKPVSRSQEFKIVSPADRDFSYVAGYFYSDNNVVLQNNRRPFLIAFGGAVKPGAYDRNTVSDTTTHGLFGRGTWKLTPASKLLAGLRVNRDRIGYARVQGAQDANPNLRSAATDTASTTVGDLTLQHDLNRDVMVYGTLARGYKPRAYDTNGDLLATKTALDLAKREDINHVELGVKGTPFGPMLQLSAALFNTSYKNYQIQVTDGTQIVPTPRLLNSPEAQTRGLELDAAVPLSAATRFNLALAFIDATFKTFTDADCHPTQTAATGCVGGKQDLSGTTMPDAPRFKAVLGAEHRVALGGLGNLTLNGQYAYRSSSMLIADRNPQGAQAGFGILNLSATATSASGKISVTAFVNNVLDKFYLVNAEDFFSGMYATANNANEVHGRPARDARRYGGVRLTYKF